MRCHAEQSEGPGFPLPQQQSSDQAEPRSLASLGMTTRVDNAKLDGLNLTVPKLDDASVDGAR